MKEMNEQVTKELNGCEGFGLREMVGECRQKSANEKGRSVWR